MVRVRKYFVGRARCLITDLITDNSKVFVLSNNYKEEVAVNQGQDRLQVEKIMGGGCQSGVHFGT